MSEELNLQTKVPLAINIKIILIEIIVLLSLIVGCAFMYHLYDTKNKELISFKSQGDLNKSISDTNAKLDDMLKREKELYPQLVTVKAELAANNIKLAKIQEAIKLTGKDTINAEVNKMDLNSISNYLLTRGYPNTIIRY